MVMRQADDGEGGHPARDVGLDLYREAVEALEAEALEDCVHGGAPFCPTGGGRAIKIFDLCCCIHLKKRITARFYVVSMFILK